MPVRENVATDAACSGRANILPDWYPATRELVERALQRHLDSLAARPAGHSRLTEAVAYSVQAGGKRLRPVLVVESCRASGGDPEAALPAAVAIELVHTFSLIHDDLPAMDDDDLRRGRPTNHRVFGEALAILAGDWLAVHALRLVAQCPVDAAIAGELVAALAEGTERMIAGQAADMAGERQPPQRELVRFIHRHKTAALIETCCRLGALCGGSSAAHREALARFGESLGLAFQVADDLLDQTASAEQMGKRTLKDAAVDKQTYPAVFGVAAARAEAERLAAEAVAALEPLGPAGQRLADLARYVVSRDH